MTITIINVYGHKIKGLVSFLGRRVFINGKKLPSAAGVNYPADWTEDFTISSAKKHFRQGAYLK
jgi:hypothetical protein